MEHVRPQLEEFLKGMRTTDQFKQALGNVEFSKENIEKLLDLIN